MTLRATLVAALLVAACSSSGNTTFTPPADVVTTDVVTTDVVTPVDVTGVDAQPDHNGVVFSVRDSGAGISESDLPHLFERFYRVDKSRSRDEGGSGLGLAICKHILDAHHQNISVRSTENVGSTFSFTLRKAASKVF